MRQALITAAMLGVVHLTVPAAAAPAVVPVSDGDGADGGRGVQLARAGGASFLPPADARQSPLVAVGEGGEGGRGRGRRRGRDHYRDGYGYGYREHYRYRYAPPGYYAPPPPPPRVYYYAPPPPPAYGYYAPAPRYAPPPRSGWVDPGW